MRWGSLILLLIFITSLSWSDSRRRLSWEPVPGAAGYYLEIRDSTGTIIAETAVKENFYEITDLEPGNYSFRVATVNLLNQKGESSPWINFTLEKLIVPELHSASSRQLIASVTSRDIIVKGNNFNRSSRFFLRSSAGDVTVAGIDIKSEREVLLNIKPETGMSGVYDLVVVNRGGADAVLKNAFTVVEKEIREKYFFTAVSYSVNVPVGTWSEYFDASFTGASIYIQTPVSKSGPTIYYFEAEVDAVKYNSTQSSRESSFLFISSGAGISLYYSLNGSVQLFTKILAGPVYNILEMDENINEKKSSSLDLYVSAGAGIRYFPAEKFFLEPAICWKTVFMAEEFFHSAGISLYAGVRF